MTLIFIIIAVAVIVIIAFYAYYYFSGRAMKKRFVSDLEQLAATTQMEEAQVQSVTTPTLSGRYRTYKFYIEVTRSKSGARKTDYWRIATKLESDLSERFYIQGDKREGKLRKVVGLDVVTTGDELFDGRILVFASDKPLAKRIFNPYMRERFMRTGLSDFAIELDGNSCVMEIYLPPPTVVRTIRHSLEVLIELVNVTRIVGD